MRKAVVRLITDAGGALQNYRIGAKQNMVMILGKMGEVVLKGLN